MRICICLTFLLTSIICGKSIPKQAEFEPCIRSCFHFKATFLLFLTSGITESLLRKIKLLVADEVEACSLLGLSFSLRLLSPSLPSPIQCCTLRDCVLQKDSLSWDQSVLSFNSSQDGVVFDQDDGYNMFDSTLKILSEVPEARRSVDSVFLLTDYGVPTFLTSTSISELAPFTGMLHVIAMSDEAANHYPNPIVIQDPLELVRSPLVPPMCSAHPLGVVAGGNVHGGRTGADAVITSDLCVGMTNYTASDYPVDLHVFVAFSENISNANFISVKELFHSLLTFAHLEENSGSVYLHGPRSRTLAICKWSGYEKCLHSIEHTDKELLQVETGAINRADLDFAPDVLSFLRRMAIQPRLERKTFAMVLSDFISTEFTINSLFFSAALDRQNLALMMAVVTERNHLTRQQILHFYGNLTVSGNIYAVPRFENISDMNVWNATSSFQKTDTSTATTVASTSSTTITGTASAPPSKAISDADGSVDTTAFDGSSDTTASTTTTTEYAYSYNDAVVVLSLSENVSDGDLRLLKDFLAAQLEPCVNAERRFGIVLPDPRFDLQIDFCSDFDCLGTRISALDRHTIGTGRSTVGDVLIGRRNLHVHPEKAEDRLPTLMLITDFVSNAFIDAYDDDHMRQELSHVDFQILLLNKTNALHLRSSLPNKDIHQLDSFQELASTSNMFCTVERKTNLPSLLWVWLASSCGVVVFVVVLFLTYRFYLKNRVLRRQNKVLTLTVQHSINLNDDDEEQALKTPSTPETVLGINWILSEMRRDPWEMDRQRIIVNRQIGKGNCGVVYKGSLLGRAPVEFIRKRAFFAFQYDNCAVAVKMMPLHFEESKRNEFLDEIDIMKKLEPHPNVCGLLGCVTSYSPLCMVVEYADCGDLRSHLKSKKLKDCPFTDCVIHRDFFCLKDLIAFCWQIADGLNFLHGSGLIHRDVAARNVLVKNDGNVLISDFGLAIWADRPKRKRSGERLPIKWTAIESLRCAEFSRLSDVWSFGVCAWEVFSLGSGPFSFLHSEELLSYLSAGKRLHRPPHCPLQIWSLLEETWSEDPAERPSLEQMKADLGKLLENLTAGYGYLELASEENF